MKQSYIMFAWGALTWASAYTTETVADKISNNSRQIHTYWTPMDYSFNTEVW